MQASELLLNETFDVTEDTIFVSKEIISYTVHGAQIKTFELNEDKIIVINKSTLTLNVANN